MQCSCTSSLNIDFALNNLFIEAVFRIRLDPYHLAGSRSTSGNADPDPSSKKNCDDTNIKINQNCI